MNDKFQNIEKFIFFTAAAFLVIVLLVTAKNLFADKDYFDKRLVKILRPETVGYGRINEPGENLMALIDDEFSNETPLKAKRNIFEKWHMQTAAKEEVSDSDALVLKLEEIGYKPLGIEYKGKIIFGDGEIVAQINIHKQSYIIKSGSPVLDYTVEQLTRKFIKLKDKQGRYTKIKYREKMYTNEHVATLRELRSNKVKVVNKNSSFLGFKVLDIDEESVLLSRAGERLRLRKGMVYK